MESLIYGYQGIMESFSSQQ